MASSMLRLQIVCFDQAVPVVGGVAVYRPPEQLVAQHEPEHVQHRGRARVEIRPVRSDAHDRLPPVARIGLDAGQLRPVHLVVELIPPRACS